MMLSALALARAGLDLSNFLYPLSDLSVLALADGIVSTFPSRTIRSGPIITPI